MSGSEHSQAPDPVFIVNTGRCGSTMLAEMLRENPRFLVLSEYLSYLSCRALSRTRLSGDDYWKWLSTQSPVLREMHLAGQKQPEVLYAEGVHGDWPLHLAPSIMLATLPFLSDRPVELYDALRSTIPGRTVESIQAHMHRVFDTLASATGRSLRIERTGDSLLLVGRLRRLFPRARFVHLVRDGRDVAKSMRGKPDFRAKVSYFGSLRQIGLDPYRPSFAYGVAPWHIWVEEIGSRFLDVRQFTDAEVTLAACGRHWRRMIEAGLRELDQVPADRVHTMRYEDLAATPAEALTALTDFLDGPGADVSWIEGAVPFSSGVAEYACDVPTSDIVALVRECSPALTRLGYDPMEASPAGLPSASGLERA